VCYTPSSEPFRIQEYLILLMQVFSLCHYFLRYCCYLLNPYCWDSAFPWICAKLGHPDPSGEYRERRMQRPPFLLWTVRGSRGEELLSFLYFCLLFHCCRDVFTAPSRSNERGADHRKLRSSIVARVRFQGNVFTEPLPSNELFRLSGVMSQYKTCLRSHFALLIYLYFGPTGIYS
jgi:hypothetical protein